MLNLELTRDLLHHLDRSGDLGLVTCEKALSEQVEKLPIPMKLKRVLQWTWPAKTAYALKFPIYGLKEILSNEWLDRLLAAEMIQISSSKSGDQIVVSFASESCEVGFVNCIELAGDEEISPRAIYVPFCSGLDEFLFRLAEQRYMPVDYVAAVELLEMKKRAAISGQNE